MHSTRAPVNGTREVNLTDFLTLGLSREILIKFKHILRKIK